MWFRGLHFSGHSASVLEFIATTLPIKFPGPFFLFWNANYVSCLNIDTWQNIYNLEFTIMDKHDNVSNYRRKWTSPRKFLAGVRVMGKENMFRPWPYKTYKCYLVPSSTFVSGQVSYPILKQNDINDLQ